MICIFGSLSSENFRYDTCVLRQHDEVHRNWTNTSPILGECLQATQHPPEVLRSAPLRTKWRLLSPWTGGLHFPAPLGSKLVRVQRGALPPSVRTTLPRMLCWAALLSQWRLRTEAFPCVSPSEGRGFWRPPPGGHFGCSGVFIRTEVLEPWAGADGTGPRKLQEECRCTEASLRFGRSTARDDSHQGRFKTRRPAPGPTPPKGLDGCGRSEGPASGKRLSSGPSRPHPHQTLTPGVPSSL